MWPPLYVNENEQKTQQIAITTPNSVAQIDQENRDKPNKM
jgi:hypothetical protein